MSEETTEKEREKGRRQAEKRTRTRRRTRQQRTRRTKKEAKRKKEKKQRRNRGRDRQTGRQRPRSVLAWFSSSCSRAKGVHVFVQSGQEAEKAERRKETTTGEKRLGRNERKRLTDLLKERRARKRASETRRRTEGADRLIE